MEREKPRRHMRRVGGVNAYAWDNIRESKARFVDRQDSQSTGHFPGLKDRVERLESSYILLSDPWHQLDGIY